MMTQNSMVDPAAPVGTEPFRPKLHFTPRRNWINDPNGLVYFEGEYHLFYQYNPEGREWGHMSWGHAVSPDLAHWQELPVAIPETDQMIFSGSIVVDHANISGLGDGKAPALLAFYTAYDAARSIQSQHLAYSHDRGRTFAHYAGNPIIDLNHADFRDPKVFYHADSAAWIMVVALAKDHVVQFYRSTNLLDWSLAGTFGPAGSTAGQWECPDLIPVPIRGEDGATAWVLKIDVDTGFLDGGSGTQYFVGKFDGRTFAVDPAQGNPNGDLVDYGPDFYAAITWAELPDDRPGPIWIGWQSNHQSGRFYPTDPWCGAMSLPRRLFLYSEDGRLRLGQVPIVAEPAVPVPAAIPEAVSLTGQPTRLASGMRDFQCTFDLTGPQGRGTIDLRDAGGSLVRMTYDRDAQHVEFDRARSSMVNTPEFGRHTIVDVPGDTVAVQIFLDGPLLEIFLNHGERVYTATIFPNGDPELTAKGVGEGWRVARQQIEPLRPTMFLSH